MREICNLGQNNHHLLLHVGGGELWDLLSISRFQLKYLVSGVDSGPNLEELPHHTRVAFGGCNHQCSVSTLHVRCMGVEGCLISTHGDKSYSLQYD